MLRRRELLRLGLATGFTALTPRRARAMGFVKGDPPPSPRTTPFVAPLPIPPVLTPVDPFSADCEPPPESDLSRLRFFRVISEQRFVRLHPELPRTQVWGYRDANTPAQGFDVLAGPTIVGRSREPLIVRHENELPRNHVGFGEPSTTVHFHGG